MVPWLMGRAWEGGRVRVWEPGVLVLGLGLAGLGVVLVEEGAVGRGLGDAAGGLVRRRGRVEVFIVLQLAQEQGDGEQAGLQLEAQGRPMPHIWFLVSTWRRRFSPPSRLASIPSPSAAAVLSRFYMLALSRHRKDRKRGLGRGLGCGNVTREERIRSRRL